MPASPLHVIVFFHVFANDISGLGGLFSFLCGLLSFLRALESFPCALSRFPTGRSEELVTSYLQTEPIYLFTNVVGEPICLSTNIFGGAIFLSNSIITEQILSD